MPGIFSTYNTAIKGLQSNSLAIQTSSNNIANADTEGYSRQRVVMSESTPYESSDYQIGTGVDVDNIERIRNKYLDAQIWHEYAYCGTYTSSQAVLEQAEIVFSSDDTGLNAAMDEMWEAWSDLAESPEGTNGRKIVVQATKTFTDLMNQMASQISTLESDTTDLIANEASKVNDLVKQIQDVSDQIYRMSIKGVEANDLEDQRGVLLDELSSLVNIDVDYDEYSRVQITEIETDTILLNSNDTKGDPPVTMSVIGDIEDVGGGNEKITLYRDGDTANPVSITVTAGTYSLSEGDAVYVNASDWADYDDGTITAPPLTKADLEEGEIAGNIDALEKLEEYETELNDLASATAAIVNEIHTYDGSEAIFETSDGTATFTAANIQVNSAVLSDVDKIQAGESGSEEGDGSRALLISKLSNIKLDMTDITSITSAFDDSTMTLTSYSGGSTLGDVYEDIVSTVGSDLQRVNNGVIGEKALVAKLEAREESISGVSIDEETVNLIQYSDLYAANSKVISTLTEMMDTVLSIVR